MGVHGGNPKRGKKIKVLFWKTRRPSVNQGHVAQAASGHDIGGMCNYLHAAALMEQLIFLMCCFKAGTVLFLDIFACSYRVLLSREVSDGAENHFCSQSERWSIMKLCAKFHTRII